MNRGITEMNAALEAAAKKDQELTGGRGAATIQKASEAANHVKNLPRTDTPNHAMSKAAAMYATYVMCREHVPYLSSLLSMSSSLELALDTAALTVFAASYANQSGLLGKTGEAFFGKHEQAESSSASTQEQEQTSAPTLN